MNIRSNSDIGFLEAFDTALDFIVKKTIENLSKNFSLDDEDKNWIELNRFERANIIVTNFYERRKEFNLINNETATKLVELIYSSLRKPYIMTGTDLSEIEYFRDNTLTEPDDESLLFNNNLFNWYDYTDYKNNNRKDLKEIIFNLINKNQNNKIYSLNEIDYNLYNTLISNPELLRELNWRTFEKLLADILEKFEYEVELQKGTKDGGIDIIAVKKDTPFGPERYLIQAKRWKNKVGVEPVQRLIWAHNHYKVTKSCLATTSVFTKGAWQLADNHKWQVELKDYDKLLEWLNEAIKNNKA